MEEKRNLIKDINEQMDMETVRQIITDNKSEFLIEGQKYHVSGLTFSQREMVHERQSKKYMELLKNPAYALEDDLKKIYKTRGTDLDQIKKNVLILTKEKEEIQIKLGEALTKNDNEGIMKKYKEQIENLDSQISEFTQTRAKLLQYCIENQVMIDAFSYIIYLITEKEMKEEGKPDWYVPAWESYDDFKKVKENLINKIAVRVSLIANPNLEF